MGEYLNRGIKEVIDEFPGLEPILDEYGIGCGPCSVGTCLFKDIVEIHNLQPDQEQEMMARVAKVINPDAPIEIPQTKQTLKAPVNEIKYSPPMQKLVDEHVLIKRLIALIPEIINNLDVKSEEGRQIVLDGIDFIRSYADKYHHAKEEEILFGYFDEDLAIIKVICDDHVTGRGFVKAALAALDDKDKEAVARHLTSYRELLTQHIKKEDEILYPWMDRNLTTTQVGELYSKFQEAEEQIGYSPDKYAAFVNNLEKKYNHQEK